MKSVRCGAWRADAADGRVRSHGRRGEAHSVSSANSRCMSIAAWTARLPIGPKRRPSMVMALPEWCAPRPSSPSPSAPVLEHIAGLVLDEGQKRRIAERAGADAIGDAGAGIDRLEDFARQRLLPASSSPADDVELFRAARSPRPSTGLRVAMTVPSASFSPSFTGVPRNTLASPRKLRGEDVDRALIDGLRRADLHQACPR